MKLFGQHIRELRIERDLPLRRVAAHLDIDTSILSKVERSERIASRKQVILAAEFFGVSREKLLQKYFGDQIARLIYTEPNDVDILLAAKEQIPCYRNFLAEQASLNFKEDKNDK